MTLGEHLQDLRLRLIRSLVVFALASVGAWFLSARAVNVLERPVTRALADAGYAHTKLLFTTVTMAFAVRLSVTLVLGALLAAPWFLIEIWKFVAVGLRPKERRAVRVYAPVSIGLFLTGVVFAYLVLLPVALFFLLSLAAPIRNAEPHLIVMDYVVLVLKFCLAAGISFQLPIVLTFLTRTGLVSPRLLRRKRRHAIVIAFIVAGALTPPDNGTTQMLLAVPLIALYELGLVMGGAYTKEANISDIPAGPMAGASPS